MEYDYIKHIKIGIYEWDYYKVYKDGKAILEDLSLYNISKKLNVPINDLKIL